jgi:hypothetical protein
MKKLMSICGVFVIALSFAGIAAAGDGNCDKPCDEAAAKTAAYEGKDCDTSAVKTAAYEGKDCDTSAVKTAGNKAGGCDTTAAKAAYDAKLAETGCEKSAKTAYINTLAEQSYHKAYDSSHCSKSAAKVAYDTVLADTGCTATASSAARHAVAQAAYDETYKTTGCSKTSKAAYDKAMQASNDMTFKDDKTAS